MATRNTAPSSTIRAVIDARNAGKKIAAVDFVANAPEIPAVLSKLVKSLHPINYDNEGNRQIDKIDQTTMQAASDEIAQRAKDADVVIDLFPEIELASQILVSAIISPKDMNSTEVNFTLPANLKVSPLAASLLSIIEDHFENSSYKIKNILPTILEDVLFRTGSYAVAVIPENSVDVMINGVDPLSMESLSEVAFSNGHFKPLGILGPVKEDTRWKKKTALESLLSPNRHPVKEDDGYVSFESNTNVKGTFKIPYLYVTDNFNALKLPQITERARIQAEDSILNARNFALESFTNVDSFRQSHQQGNFNTTKLNDEQLSGLFYKNKYRPHKTVVKVKSDDEISRSMIGEPLIMKLPSESVIPVYTPGNEERHIAYFVLIDMEGNPVSRTSVTMRDHELRSRMSLNNDMNSYLLNQAASNFQKDCSQVTFQQASKVYADIIESDLLSRLRNGIVGPAVSIAKNEEVYRIMLARSLMQQGTQLLYVPKSLLTYFAYKYNDYGVGVSLLDKMRTLNALRAILLFSRTMAQVKNSIGRSKALIKLDPNDPNPQKTVEIGMHEVARLRQIGIPLNTYNAQDLVNWVNKAGIEFGIEGHPGLPDTSIEYSEHSTSFTEPNPDLNEELRKNAIMGFGLSPETVDAGYQAEFATTVVANNLMLSKRVKKIQECIVPLLSDHCRKATLNNSYIFQRVKDTIRENLKKLTEIKNVDPLVDQYKDNNEDLLVHLLTLEFLSNFEVSLSQPDLVSLKNQMESFEFQEQILDKALGFYIDSSILPASMTGEAAGERVDEIRAIVKAHYMREWMGQNNIMSELSDIGSVDEEGQPVMDFGAILRNHIHAMTKSTVTLLGDTVPVAQAADKDIEKITGGDDLGDSSSDYSSDDSGSDGGDEAGDDDGFGDFGGDDLFGGGGEESGEGGEKGSSEEGSTNDDLNLNF